MPELVIWQRIVSPHMAPLAVSLAAKGAQVTYVAETLMSPERARQGWTPPDLPGVRIEIIDSADAAMQLVNQTGSASIHLTQGVRGNGYISGVIRQLLAERRRWGAMLETVNDRSAIGYLKRQVYAWKLRPSRRPGFILAIGDRTSTWISLRGFPYERVYPFAYFLTESSPVSTDQLLEAGSMADQTCVRIGFVGQLIQLKRVDLLIHALAALLPLANFRLVVVGPEPESLSRELKSLAEQRLGAERVEWLGTLPLSAARQVIATLDCLVLPSEHDGWGAVISEALMAGVPAICSDACGAAVAIRASSQGGVFASGNLEQLQKLLRQQLQQGSRPLEARRRLAAWARCLTADAGADYLLQVLDSVYSNAPRPLPPWGLERKQLESLGKA